MQNNHENKASRKGSREPANLNYHSGFVSGLEVLLWPYRGKIDIESERWLSTGGLRMDVLLQKKDPALKINSDICRIFRTHNIIEYKSPDDSLSIDIFAKVMSYAHLYKSQGASVDAISYDDISATIYRHAFPREAFRKLEDYGAFITQGYPGVFYVHGMAPFPTQVLVGKLLDIKEYAMFKVLKSGASDEEIRSFKDMAIRIRDTAYQKYVDAIYQVSVTANMETYIRLQKEDPAMCDALKDLMQDYIDEEVKKRTLDSENRILEAEKRRADAERQKADAERQKADAERLLIESENGRISDTILVYHDELKISPEQITRKIMTRYGLSQDAAERHVTRTLHL